MSIVYLLLGSNLGNRQKYLKDAVLLISAQAGSIIKTSSVYESPPWGFEHPQNFLNQAIEIETVLSPSMLLQETQRIEKMLGREENTSDTYEARSIDIDILFYDFIMLDKKDLCIPHPQLHLRRFALQPLVEMNPEFIHPLLQKSVQQLLNECPDESNVDIAKTTNTTETKEAGHAS